MHQAFRTPTEIVARTRVAAGTLPGSYELYRVAAEPADQVIGRVAQYPLSESGLNWDGARTVSCEAESDDTRCILSWPGRIGWVDDSIIGLLGHTLLPQSPYLN
jgi:hypothetical protein